MNKRKKPASRKSPLVRYAQKQRIAESRHAKMLPREGTRFCIPARSPRWFRTGPPRDIRTDGVHWLILREESPLKLYMEMFERIRQDEPEMAWLPEGWLVGK